MKKVIYIGYMPLTSKVYNDFYLDFSIKNGLEVEYWDITQLYFPKIDFGKSFTFVGVKFFNSFKTLKLSLSEVEIKSTIFIINITYHYRVWRLFKLLTSFDCRLAFFGRGAQPSITKPISLILKEIIVFFEFNKIIIFFANKLAALFKKYKIVKPYDFIFSAGSEGYKITGVGNQFDISKAKLINVNYFDFDKYLDVLESKPDTIIEKPYCVFLDEYLPYHPDVNMLGIKTVNADKYYLDLNTFFSDIECKYNVNVVIAAHPKAENYKSKNPFNDRAIFFNKACELVSNASFVITHHSTAISYPILYKKPLIFITSQSQKKNMLSLYKQTMFLAQVLNSIVVHFDNLKEDLNFFVDIEKYDDYKYKYLTSKETENKKSCDIFMDTIFCLK